jgi:hypothetical protein
MHEKWNPRQVEAYETLKMAIFWTKNAISLQTTTRKRCIDEKILFLRLKIGHQEVLGL